MRRNEAALAAIELMPKLLAGRAEARPVGRAVRGQAALARHHRADRLRRTACGRARNWPRPAPRRGSERSIRPATPRPRRSEEIGAATPGPKWMQVFLYKDRGLTAEFAARAAARRLQGADPHRRQSGDGGPRPRRAQRHDLSVALGSAQHRPTSPAIRAGSCAWRGRRRRPSSITASVPRSAPSARLMAEQLDPAVGWSDVDWLRGQWHGPLAIKGLLHRRRRAGGGKARRRRHYRFQSRRAATRRRNPIDRRAAGNRRCARWRHSGPGRRRLPPRGRRGQGAGARRAGGADRPAASLGRGLRRRGGRPLDARTLSSRNRPRPRPRKLGQHRQARSGRRLSPAP